MEKAKKVIKTSDVLRKILDGIKLALTISAAGIAGTFMFTFYVFCLAVPVCALLLMIQIVVGGFVIGSAWAVILGIIGCIITAGLFTAMVVSIIMTFRS